MSTLENLRKLHKSVLLDEVLEAFGLTENIALSNKRLKIIDTTLGIGGHTEELIHRGSYVFGIDQDAEMLKLAEQRLNLACPTPEGEPQKFVLVKGSFKDLYKIASVNDFLDADGVLFDLGVSSPQITSKSRGFSFQNDAAALDMRLDQDEMGVRAMDLLNVLRIDQLTELFAKVIRYPVAKAIAKRVVDYRSEIAFETIADFKTAISDLADKKNGKNASTLPFLALRIAVNSELETLSKGLEDSVRLLKSGGKIVVISFHSLEDKITDNKFNEFESESLGRQLTKKPIKPLDVEVERNRRSRSALMRVFQKNEQKVAAFQE